ncbi:conserved hypothetical protein [Histoplasma capsulatum H143]|uniref:Peptidase S7 domain-containing protein n=1 Tax=Ajellomyces capsulatus (strain H143) TaxID=544712 RepID=C6HTH3_AJECH|nr:conserved hypothetical protein [Histoplasma capsulatum H143]
MATVTVSRRAANRSTEDCYASPAVLPLGPPTTSQTHHPAPKRQKRSSGSSSDSDETINGIRVEDFRVGGPYLCALPAKNFTTSQQHPATTKWNSQFEWDIINLLNHHSVHCKSLNLVDRRSAKYEDSGETETVVVSATRTKQDRSWLDACLEIRAFFQFHGLPTLNIEIIDERASMEKYTFPVFENDKIYSKWNDLSSQICQLIGMEGWLSLECFRRGTNLDRQNNPPTIILTIPMDSIKTWKAERDQITSLLDAEGLEEVAVEVLRSYVWRATDVDLVVLLDNAWEHKAQLGMSIGLHGSDISGFTFGGFLQLLHPSTKQWHTFGVMCYHCIEPEQGGNDSSGLFKDIKKWREKGMTVNEATTANIRIDQPAIKDHLARMNMIEQRKVDWMKSPLQKRVKEAMINDEFIISRDEAFYKHSEAAINQSLVIKNKAEKFFATGNALLGRVFAASGYRSTPNPDRRQLDWALIQVVTPRIGSNNVPPVGSYEDENGSSVFSGELMGQPPKKKILHELSLYKIGRRTNFTTGKYQSLRTLHLESWKTDDKGKKLVVVTEEEAIASKKGSLFSAKGDSGSFIFDEEANFVGLLFAGNMDTGVGYFTPATILFEDIKAMTGALDVRLPLS